MKITKNYLKKVIEESLEQIKNESEDNEPIQGSFPEPYYKRHLKRAEEAVDKYLPKFERQGIKLEKVYNEHRKEILSHLADAANQREYSGGWGVPSEEDILKAFLRTLVK